MFIEVNNLLGNSVLLLSFSNLRVRPSISFYLANSVTWIKFWNYSFFLLYKLWNELKEWGSFSIDGIPWWGSSLFEIAHLCDTPFISSSRRSSFCISFLLLCRIIQFIPKFAGELHDSTAQLYSLMLSHQKERISENELFSYSDSSSRLLAYVYLYFSRLSCNLNAEKLVKVGQAMAWHPWFKLVSRSQRSQAHLPVKHFTSL